MSPLGEIVWRVFLGLVMFFMVTPLLLVVLFSFGESALAAFPLGTLSFKWYEVLFERDEFWNSFRNSLQIAVSVGIISTIIGTLSAMALSRLRARSATPVIAALSFPIMLPALVVGVALLSFYSTLGLPLSVNTVIISHLVITQPFVILVIYARMVSFDYAIVESARDLGASPLRAFFTVTLPVVRSTVIGAAFIVMAISLDEFIITFFTIGGGNTLPTFVWGMLRTSVDPQINAIATILISLTVGSMVIALKLSRYRG